MKIQEQIMEQNRLSNEIIEDTKKHLKELIARNTQPVDDVQYNQEWWEWYCREHKLDVHSGLTKKLPKNPFHVLF